MLITEGALVWPTVPASAPAGADPTQWAEAVAAAVEHLWAASGRQYGTRVAVYRPQALCLSAGYYDAIPYLQSVYGELWGQGWPFISDPRSPRGRVARQVLELPGPAVSVSAVETVDSAGVVTAVAASAYRLDGNYLVRTDGGDWPLSQDLINTAGSATTWKVTYVRGNVVPTGGQVAAYLLAQELLKAIAGSKTCLLPYNTTTVSRAGVTINRDVLRAMQATGVEAADRWVSRVNPQGLQQPPAVWSPDVPRGGTPYAGSSYRP